MPFNLSEENSRFYKESSYLKYNKNTPGNYSKYSKIPTTFEEQVRRLEKRGMLIEDREYALNVLSKISYYHLSPYWKPFCNVPNSDDFNLCISFSRVMQIYQFDKTLRELLLKYIAPIEVAYKTQFVNLLCHVRADPFAYLDKENFRDESLWESSVNKIISEFEKSKEKFAEHHKKSYQGIMPPLWIASELLTLGELNKWCENLKDDIKLKNSKNSVRDSISLFFGIKSFSQFTSFIRSLTNIRNFCAHQCRVWDRDLFNQPKQPKGEKTFLYKVSVNYSVPRFFQ